jgi:hypothetical protein
MKVEYEVQVSGVGLPIERDSRGISDAARLYAAVYHLVALAFAAAIKKGNPVRSMAFFQSAISSLQTLVVALGAGLGAWGVINLLEGYGNDNPGAKSQGIKQLMAGGGVCLIGTNLIPLLANLF